MMANDLMNGRSDMMDLSADRFFNRLARDFFGNVFDTPSTTDQMKTDISESDQAYTVKVELPGFKKENLSLDYQHGILQVSGKLENNTKETDDNGNVLRSERHYGTYQRQYRLPNVQRDQITAAYHDGILTITLPKQAPTADEKPIQIN